MNFEILLFGTYTLGSLYFSCGMTSYHYEMFLFVSSHFLHSVKSKEKSNLCGRVNVR